MSYGERAPRQRPNDAVRSSRAPRSASVVPRPCPSVRGRRKTVLKWRKRTTTADAPMGPAKPHSTTLTEAGKAIVVEFRRRTLLPLDDVLGCLRDSIPKLTRSALHRCLVRHDLSRRPKDPTDSSKRKTFKNTEIGYVHIDSCEPRSAEGKLHMVRAIDRVSKFSYVGFRDSPGKLEGAAFLRGVVKAFPTKSAAC